MGGGSMSPAISGGYCGSAGGATITRTSTIPDHQFHFNQQLSVLSRVPYRPPSSEIGGLVEACDESLDFACGNEEEIAKRLCFDSGFGPAPSRLEVERAMYEFQRYMDSKNTPEVEGLTQMFSHTDSRMLQLPARGRLDRAFSLLQKDPPMQEYIQRMVMSISCDKAVWDAIISNKAVQNLQGPMAAAKVEQAGRSMEEGDMVNLIMKLITGISKSRIGELIEKFVELVAEIFTPGEKEKPTSELTDLVEEKIRSSLLLSVVILMIVIVTRNNGV